MGKIPFRQLPLWLIVTGIGVGWLIGLSVSPVVSIVITSIVGSAAAIVAALSGLNEADQEESPKDKPYPIQRPINPMPLALLVLGMLFGSATGVLARNQHWLGSDVSGEVKKWTDFGLDRKEVLDTVYAAHYPLITNTIIPTETLAAELEWWVQLGMPREEATRRLFENRYSILSGTSNSTPPDTSSSGTFLFAIDAMTCTSLLAAAAMSTATGDETHLRQAMASSTVKQVRQLPDVVTDPKVLHEIVEQVLCIEDQ